MFRAMFGFEGTNLHKKKVILDSSMVEHSAVNRVVVGSSPTRGVFEQNELNFASRNVLRRQCSKSRSITCGDLAKW